MSWSFGLCDGNFSNIHWSWCFNFLGLDLDSQFIISITKCLFNSFLSLFFDQFCLKISVNNIDINSSIIIELNASF